MGKNISLSSEINFATIQFLFDIFNATFKKILEREISINPHLFKKGEINKDVIVDTFLDIIIAQDNDFPTSLFSDLVRKIEISIPPLSNLTIEELRNRAPGPYLDSGGGKTVEIFAVRNGKTPTEEIKIPLGELVLYSEKKRENLRGGSRWDKANIVLGLQHALWIVDHQNDNQIKPFKKLLASNRNLVGFCRTFCKSSFDSEYIAWLTFNHENKEKELELRWHRFSFGL